MKITVIGTGYLGAVHAACMARIGHEVLGVDVDAAKIEVLAHGRTPFYEPELGPLLQEMVESGQLRFSTCLDDAAAFGDVHFVCVGTPQRPRSNAADLRYVDAVIEDLVPRLSADCLIIGKSTVPVGTAQRLSARIASLAQPGTRIELAWNPEFLREGHAVQDTLRPDRIVTGTRSAEADEILRQIYEPMIDQGIPYIATDLQTAELVKVSANAFLATKISFINAIADVCECVGADVVTLADAIGYDPRIGRRFLSAGLGFGGGCLPKDIRAFMARAGELGAAEALSFLREIDEINMARRAKTVALARELLGGRFLGRSVAVLGAAFKPDSDDVRDSPALNVAASIHLQGAEVRVHDPAAIENARHSFPTLDYTDDIEKACEAADVVLHLTEWAQYRDLDPISLAGIVSAPRILDARNVLDVHQWRSSGWTVRSLGRPGR